MENSHVKVMTQFSFPIQCDLGTNTFFWFKVWIAHTRANALTAKSFDTCIKIRRLWRFIAGANTTFYSPAWLKVIYTINTRTNVITEDFMVVISNTGCQSDGICYLPVIF